MAGGSGLLCTGAGIVDFGGAVAALLAASFLGDGHFVR